MYTLKLKFSTRKPTPDQQFILEEAFKSAFHLQSFPQITFEEIEGVISENDLDIKIAREIPSYLNCSGFPVTGEIIDSVGISVPCIFNYESQYLGDNSWGRFSETCRNYGL